MIEITLSSIGDLCGYLGAIWCVVNLVWGVFRNDAPRCLIYTAGTVISVIVMLNIGGVLNERSWGIFGCGVFGLHALYATATGEAAWKVVLFTVLCATSALSVLGLI